MATDPHPQFTKAMFDIYLQAKKAGYHATIFLQMLTDRYGQATAKTLINAARPSDGYEALHRMGRLDLTVKAMIVENSKWHGLFTKEEIEKARGRLKEYGYKPN